MSEEMLRLRKMLKKRKPYFIRKDSFKKSKFGKRRKKKQIWRKPKGPHSKIRMKERSYLKQPSIGYSSPKAVKGLVEGKKPAMIYNVRGLENVKENEIAVIGKIGRRKKFEIAQAAAERNIKILNLDPKKFIEEMRKEQEKRSEAKKKTVQEKKTEEKKHEAKHEEKKEKEEGKAEEVKK